MPSRGFSRGRGRLEPDRCSRDLSDMTARTSPSLSLPSAPAELDRWRRETPGCRERIHLNNAGAALMPQPVLQALTGFLEREAAIGGYEAADEAEPRVRETYELLGRLVGAAARNVAIVQNATVAFSQARSAFDFRPGDRIITTRADFPSIQLTYLSLARRAGVETVRADDLPEGGVDPASVRQLARHARTRLVALSWVPTNSGLVQDAGAVGEVCAELGVPYLIDACQAVGQLAVDVAALRCDFLAGTGRKFLRGPRGIGFLYVSDRMLERGAFPLFLDMRGADWTDPDAFRLAGGALRSRRGLGRPRARPAARRPAAPTAGQDSGGTGARSRAGAVRHRDRGRGGPGCGRSQAALATARHQRELRRSEVGRARHGRQAGQHRAPLLSSLLQHGGRAGRLRRSARRASSLVSVARPGKIIGIGRNYRDHAAELGNTVPAKPLLFLKPPTAVIGDGAAIVLPPESQQVDFEGEIGVVIGRPLRRATDAEARAGIAGITCVNDVTARDLQRAEEQWTRAKGFDTFCPVGPRVVPLDPRRFDELEVFCRVNGKERQHGRAADMVFSIATLVSVVSHVMTLEAGDLIATGTPAGVGPLAPGDVVEVEIPGVGVLRNPVVREAQ